MVRPKAAAGKKPRAPPKNTHQLAEALPPGETLTDIFKKTWCLGKAVGSGGFGLIYLASPGDDKSKEDYVIKVEPHSNGPLFCELNFYQRVAKPDFISAWMSSKKKKCLGVPKYIAFGSYERKGERYRFMVMERFGNDLQKLFEENGKVFSRKTVLQIGLSLIDCLEYIHDKGYAHADIKASNLLLGYHKAVQHQVYLVDYGLAFRFNVDGKHKEYKADPRKAHDGTIEFTSRDAHLGVTPSRRADLEILGYCLVQWLCSRLPWEDNLENKDYVRDQKMKHMKNIPSFLKTCFKGQAPPEELKQYLEYVVDLDYDEIPDYNYVRSIFTKALKKNGYALDGKLDLQPPSSPVKKTPAKAGRKRKSDPSANESLSTESDSPERPARRRPRAASPRAGPSSAKKVKPSPKQLATPAKCAGNSIIPAQWKPPARGTPGKQKVTSPAKRGGGKENGITSPPVKSGKVTKAKDRKGKLVSASVATQTSPGLKGLPRSWKKNK